MCGIAGTFRLTGSVLAEDVSAVLRMLDAQIRRGPDDWGLLVPDSALADAEIRRLLERYDPAHVHAYPAVPGAPAAVLGSRRLSIIDLSTHGRMPMGSDDGRRWVVQNGEIYNYRELRAELVGAGAFRSATDTEVLVRGWEAWEDGVTERLRGMFAFALFEAAPRPRLLLGRDRFGIKPLYCYEDRTRVVFASEVRAIVASGLVPDEASPEALGRFLELGSVPAPLTTVKDVRALPAGHVAHVDASGLRLSRYWSLDAAVDAARSSAPHTRANAVDSTRALLENAVKLHLVSDAPLGVFLSGGIDSAGLVALAASGRERPLTTLTVSFDDARLSEARYARLISERYRTDHHEVRVAGGRRGLLGLSSPSLSRDARRRAQAHVGAAAPRSPRALTARGGRRPVRPARPRSGAIPRGALGCGSLPARPRPLHPGAGARAPGNRGWGPGGRRAG